jgi:hypothetical protein
LASFASQAHATIVVTLGDQDFVDGAIVHSDEFEAAQIGEPAPIGTILGSDDGDQGSNGAASFTFNYAAGVPQSASITIGLLDHDSQAPGSQVDSFSVDGVDLTVAFDALLESHGGAQIEYNVYTLNLTGAALAVLSDGSATFSLGLKGPGLSSRGPPANFTAFNAFGLDFAQLTVVPEPETYALLLAGLGALGCATPRRRTRTQSAYATKCSGRSFPSRARPAKAVNPVATWPA